MAEDDKRSQKIETNKCNDSYQIRKDSSNIIPYNQYFLNNDVTFKGILSIP